MAEDLVNTTKDYYDSEDADNFYHTIWGGEDIHVGLYQGEGDDITEASKRSVLRMIEMLPKIDKDTRILDIGAGYGGAGRYLASEFGCEVVCMNLSTTENERNEQKTKEAGLDHLVSVEGGNFEDMRFGDNEFDVVWCQDSILHSNNKFAVFQEAYRVLKEGGDFIFTDPMQSDDCPDGVLDPILKRIHLEEMGSVKKYRQFAEKLGFKEVEIDERGHQLGNHYGRVQEELVKHKAELREKVSQEYIDNMYNGLTHWVEGEKNGYLNWGFLQFRK